MTTLSNDLPFIITLNSVATVLSFSEYYLLRLPSDRWQRGWSETAYMILPVLFYTSSEAFLFLRFLQIIQT